MALVFVGLGSNLGDRRANLNAALDALRVHPQLRVLRVSAFLDNPPQGGPPQPDYLNAVAELETSLEPRPLLDLLLAVERQAGRVRAERWGPRVLDLDLLLYGQSVIVEPDLTVPHPRMHERRFVLHPLAELAPDLVHPLLRKTIRELLAAL